MPEFSHVPNFTGYMQVVVKYFARGPTNRRVLDVPAGNGLLADELKGLGYSVLSGDINHERPDYAYVDMAQRLPFTDGEFDAAVCLEGVEHLVDPVLFIAELSRVTRRGGTIVITTPNVISLYSRLQYLFTGVPYQFNPAAVPPLAPGEVGDRGHVFPMSYFQLRYQFDQHGVRVTGVLGDRYKRKLLMPVYLFLMPFVWLWTYWLFLQQGIPVAARRNREMLTDALSAPLLFSRSLVLVLEKQ